MDWDLIQKMRQGFLDTDGHLPDYWQDERWLDAYEQTLAQRIRWKWQAVLQGLQEPLQSLTGISRIVDWGCGTGIATRSVLAATGWTKKSISLLDRSPAAMRFAAKMIEQESPDQTIELVKKVSLQEPFLLLISHVLSELDESGRDALHSLVKSAAAVLWVEPGRSLESRRLSQVRDALCPTYQILGPCRHTQACGALLPDREADWCHFFAPVPREVHQSAFWREFSKRLHVDLRSLPVSWLAAVRPLHFPVAPAIADDALIISRPRVFKGYCRFLACTAQGLCSGDFQKKHDKAIYAALSEPDFMTFFPKEKLIRNDHAPL